MGNNQCARGGIKLFGLLEQLDTQTSAREQRGGEEPRGRTANDGNALLNSRRASPPFVVA
jgi:hypothetical protein